jgi:hypothetical protein
MYLLRTYTGPEARRFALKPLPFGAGWPEVVYEAETIAVCVSEPGEPGHHLLQLLVYDTDGNEVGRKKLGGSKR